jgi:hypothetical protein
LIGVLSINTYYYPFIIKNYLLTTTMEPSPSYYYAVEQDQELLPINVCQTPPPSTIFKPDHNNIDTKTIHNSSQTFFPSSLENHQEQLSQIVLLLTKTNEGSEDHLLNNNRHNLAARYCELITILKRDRGSEFQDNVGAFHNVVEVLERNIDGQNNPEVVKWGFKAMIALAPDVVNVKKFKNSLAPITCKVVIDCLRLWGQVNSEIAHDGCTIVGILTCSSSSSKKKLKELGAADVVKNALVNPFMNKSDKDVVLSWLR